MFMRYFFLILCSALFLNLKAQSFDKTSTKRELKAYLSNMEDYHKQKIAQNNRINDLQQKVNQLTLTSTDCDDEIRRYKNKIDSLTSDLSKIKAKEEQREALASRANAAASNTMNISQQNNSNHISGGQQVSLTPHLTPYRVQIGAFRMFNISHMFATTKYLNVSQQSGMNVYEITGFNSAQEAYAMAQELKKMGLKDAFVSRYVNGMKDFTFDILREPGALAGVSSPSSFGNPYNPASTSFNPNGYNNMNGNSYQGNYSQNPVGKGVNHKIINQMSSGNLQIGE